jgi:hypothetical protein
MNVTPESVLWIIGIGASVGTTLFWGVFNLGRMQSEIVRGHKRLDDHDDVFDEVLGELQLRRRSDHSRNRTSSDQRP